MAKKKAKKSTEKPKFEWSWKNKKFRAAVPFFIIVVLYLLVWTGKGEKPVDPWYKAARLVDSSRKIENNQLSSRLYSEGLEKLQDLTEKYPYHARVHFLLGYAYMVGKKWDSAMSHFKTTIKIDSGNTINPVAPDAIRQYAMALIFKSNPYFKQKKYDEALEILDKGKIYASFSPQLSTQIGMTYHNLGQLDSAQHYYSMALDSDPDFKPARNNLSILLKRSASEAFHSGDNAKAVELYQKLIQLNPKDSEAYEYLALTLNRLGDINRAVQMMEQAVNINPKNRSAISNLISFHSQLGNKKKAENYRNMLANLK